MGQLTEFAATFGTPVFISAFIAVSVKAAVVLVGALALTTLLRRAPASTRHQVWTLALLSVLALPALSLTLPAWQVAMLPQAATDVAATTAPGFSAEPRDTPRSEAGSAAEATTERFEHDPIASAETAVAPIAAAAVPAAASAGNTAPADPAAAEEPSYAEVAWQALSGNSLAGSLLVLWAVGVGYLLARLSFSTLGAWWLVRSADPVTDESLRGEAEAVRRDLGVAAEVRLVRSDRISMPMAWGILRPTILLPRESSAWSSDRRRVVLLHEMAHLQRRDCLTLMLARVVTALHWFNPLSWTATRRLQAERERACDDLVLSSGTAGADYAQHLLDIARAMRRDRSPAWATVAMARPSELEGRLLAILDPGRRRSDVPRARTTAATLLAIGALVLPLAALQPSAVAQEPDDGEQAIKLEVRPQINEELALNLAPRLQLDLGIEPRLDVNVELALPHALETGLEKAAAGGLSAAMSKAISRELAGGSELQDAGAQSGAVNARVMEAFATALRDEDASIRAQAAHALGSMESEEGVELLSAALRDDDDVSVRSQAAWALGMIESDAAIPALADALANDEDRVRKQAVWALGMIESTESVPSLSIALGDADADIRSQAAWALGMIESPDAVAALVDALGDAEVSVRSQAAWALGMIEDAAAVDGLNAALRNDDSAKVRKQAAWALGMIEDEGGIDALLDAMTDEDLEVRKTALWAVGQISG